MLLAKMENTCSLVNNNHYTQLDACYEEERRTVWMMLNAHPRPSFNYQLIEEIMNFSYQVQQSGLVVDFWVTGSSVPGIYNTGGDLLFFIECIRNKRREALRAYARACIDCLHSASRGFGTGAVSIAMVEGSALGGGLEAALAHHFVFAQCNARMGFPEITFNMFPGMGGYSLVARRSGMKLAERMIMNGESHKAEWCKKYGLVDQVFAPGDGICMTRAFIDATIPKLNGVRAMLRGRDRVMNINRSELMDITEDWVESAFRLSGNDIAYMERLLILQQRFMASTMANDG